MTQPAVRAHFDQALDVHGDFLAEISFHAAFGFQDLADFVELQKTKAESENSWSINLKDIDQATFDLSAKNPNKKEDTALRQPQEILAAMKALDEEREAILSSILELI